MSTIEHVELLKDLVQQAIDRGATSVEQVHQAIGELPFETLERLGVLKSTSRTLREKHRQSIGMVYDAIRTVNREVGQLLSDQFELIEDGRHIEGVLKRKQKHPASDDGRKSRKIKSQAAKD